MNWSLSGTGESWQRSQVDCPLPSGSAPACFPWCQQTLICLPPMHDLCIVRHLLQWHGAVLKCSYPLHRFPGAADGQRTGSGLLGALHSGDQCELAVHPCSCL